jgi:hypothetical protein
LNQHKLDEWYAEISSMEGEAPWGPIAAPLPSSEGITVNRLHLESAESVDIYLPAESDDTVRILLHYRYLIEMFGNDIAIKDAFDSTFIIDELDEVRNE